MLTIKTWWCRACHPESASYCRSIGPLMLVFLLEQCLLRLVKSCIGLSIRSEGCFSLYFCKRAKKGGSSSGIKHIHISKVHISKFASFLANMEICHVFKLRRYSGKLLWPESAPQILENQISEFGLRGACWPQQLPGISS